MHVYQISEPFSRRRMCMIRMRSVLACSAILLFLFSPGSRAQEDPRAVGQGFAIGIDEQLGATIPLSATFTDEDSTVVRLGDLITRPTIISLVYYRCPSICKPLLSGVAEVLGKMDLIPGKDYNVITISFDETDKPSDSRRMKRDYLAGIGRPFPKDSWRFLTGDTANIHLITDAVGFRYRRSGNGFAHPAGIVVVTGEGKIARYLYGITYLPFDLKMALLEASQGKVSPTIAKVLLFCFNYDSEGKRYVLSVTRVGGAGVLILVAIFAVVLLARGRKRRRS
jgi:protein SCO1/2